MVGEILRLILIFSLFLCGTFVFLKQSSLRHVICLNLMETNLENKSDLTWLMIGTTIMMPLLCSWKVRNHLGLGFQSFSRKKKTTSCHAGLLFGLLHPLKVNQWNLNMPSWKRKNIISKNPPVFGVPCFQLQGCIFFGVLERLLKNT